LSNPLPHRSIKKISSSHLLKLGAVVTCLSGGVVGAEKEVDESNIIDSSMFKSRFSVNQLKQTDYSFFNACPTKNQPIDLSFEKDYKSANDKKPDKIQVGSIKLTADDVPENNEIKTVLEGNVTMRTDTSLLLADRLVSDKTIGKVTATGNVSVETEESLLRAKQFVGDEEDQSSKLSDVKFHFFSNNANGQAESISLSGQGVAKLNDLTFSTCPTGDNSWRFSASELELDQKSQRGEAWGMLLRVKDIPVFYFPYLSFPIGDQRKSGLLAPAISNNSRNGVDVTLPIYWNIAENMDATFQPRHIQNRGSQLGVELRYLNQKSVNKLSFEWLDDDQLVSELLVNEPSLANGIYGLDKERWAVSFSNQTRFNHYWSSSVSASKVSDRDYFRDLGLGLIQSQLRNGQTQLLSQADLSYQDDIWFVSLFAESVQSIVGDEPYRILPSLISSADYFHPVTGLRWQFESDFTRFDHSDKNKMIGQRFNALGAVSFPLQNSYSWLTPKLSYQLTHYQQQDILSNDKDSISRNLPIFSLDSGLYFDRAMQWKKQSITHSLEPRIFYAYIPNEEQQLINNFDTRTPDFSFSQLWRENRFSGVDRIGDTNHIAVALTNRFVKDKTGEQLLSLSMGRKFYFEDRQVQLTDINPIDTQSVSPWLLEVNYSATANIEFSGFIEWSDEKDSVGANRGTNLARSRIKFEPIEDHIVNLSHRVRNNEHFNNEELDLSFAWPINDEWRLVGRWYNDLQNNRTSETLFGFEYESCCWAVSIVSHRYLDVRLDSLGNPLPTSFVGDGNEEFNSGVQLQFVFKGLGNPGEKGVSKLLEKNIRGYRSRF